MPRSASNSSTSRKDRGEPGIEPDRVADDFWREAVALKRYRSHPMMLIGDEPQSYPSYRDIAVPCHAVLRSWFAIWLQTTLAQAQLVSFQVDTTGEIRAAQQWSEVANAAVKPRLAN